MKRTTFLRAANAGIVVLGARPAQAAAQRTSAAAIDPRAQSVYFRRVAAAAADRAAFAASMSNGDEARYAGVGYVGSYRKFLPHEADGRVVRAAYESYRDALVTGSLKSLEPFHFPPRFYDLVSRMFSDATEIAGCDGHGLPVPAAPRLDSLE